MHDWPQNLERWFDWLPDGAVIAGERALHAGDDGVADQYFIEAARRGVPVFTEGLGLLARRLRGRALETVGGKRVLDVARFAASGRLTVTLRSFDPLDPTASSRRRRLRFGPSAGWIAFRGNEPDVY
jgi:hypothetical protein